MISFLRVGRMRKILLYGFLLVGCNMLAQSEHTAFLPVGPGSLSNSFARCFLKDSRGYMWIGTADGLLRYDGTKLYRYEHDPMDKNSIGHNNINVIVEDSKQNLWVGTARGLNRYDREKDHFINIDSIPENKNHLNNAFITSLVFADDSSLWIGTHGGGINVYDPSNFTFSHLQESVAGKTPKATDYVNSLLSVNGRIWSGTKGGLLIYDAGDRTPAHLPLVGKELPANQITQLVGDGKGDIWLATVNGDIIKTSLKNGYYSFEKRVSGDSIRTANWSNMLTLCIDDKDNLWVGGENSGLNYLNTKTNKITHFGADHINPKKMTTNSIRTVYRDDTGLIWIGTFNRGVYLINNNVGKFDSYRFGAYLQSDLEGKSVKAFAEDKNGDIWIAYDDVGLVRMDAKTGNLQRCDPINRQLGTKFFTAMKFDGEGNLWVGTAGNGAYKINLATKHVANYPLRSGGFGDNKVSCFYEDGKGTFWGGTNGSGLFHFDEKAAEFKLLYEEDVPNFITKTSYVSCLWEDYEGTLWVGTMYGLYGLTKKGQMSYDYSWHIQDNRPGSLSSSSIQVLYEDAHKNLWVGTTDNGLNVKKVGSSGFEIIQKKDGLPSNAIRGILPDSSGNLWISGNMGISRFDPTSGTFVNYTRSDGLASNNFYSNAGLTSSNGKLYFGSNNGINTFYPDSIKSKWTVPKVYLTDLKIDNRSVGIGTEGSPLEKHIGLTSSIELSPTQRSFTIDFVALNFEHSFRYEYCYKLQGFDKDWNCVGQYNSATYTNLDPGDYVFLVRASNPDGSWSNLPQRLEITIRPILWKTWWAILFYILFTATVAYFFIRMRMERVKMKNQLAMERLAREREHELIESKTQFFNNISHEFRTPLSLISMPLENLMNMEDLSPTVKGRLRSIDLSTHKMKRLVNELMDFNKLESAKLKLQLQDGELVAFISGIAAIFNDLAIKRDITFEIQSTIRSLEGWFDHDKLEKVLVNILSNAFRFTDNNGRIKISIDQKELLTGEPKQLSRCLFLAITDNGVGIPKEELALIFDKFYQVRSTAKIANAGTGIGLSLAKGLVELHKGTIIAVSELGVETQFTICIPIDRHCYSEVDICNAPVCLEMLEESYCIEDDLYKDDGDDGEKGHGKPLVLIVEDNDQLRNYISMELRDQFQILEARDGEKGLEMAVELVPDLIISDILMPVKTGIELCNGIKGNLRTSHIPFIMLTARTTVEDQISGIRTGADIYITKPFSIRFLTVQVNQLIASRQKLYSQFSQDVYLIPNKMASNELDQAFLQKAIDYIVENVQNPQLGVNSIASLFNLSRMQTYRKIKALTGKSVVNFIRMVRIKQALALMETQRHTLTEIAYLTGFNSASYFTTCFKDQYGKAPSEYLEQKC